MALFPRLFKNPILLGTTVAALCINALHWMYVSAHLVVRDVTVPVHYNIYFGIDLVGPWWYHFVVPAVGSGVILANIMLAVSFHPKKEIAAYYSCLSAVLATGMLFLASYLVLSNV